MKNHLLRRLVERLRKIVYHYYEQLLSISIFLFPDPEIIRFLEMLEEDNHVADMVANKNKKVSSALWPGPNVKLDVFKKFSCALQ